MFTHHKCILCKLKQTSHQRTAVGTYLCGHSTQNKLILGGKTSCILHACVWHNHGNSNFRLIHRLHYSGTPDERLPCWETTLMSNNLWGTLMRETTLMIAPWWERERDHADESDHPDERDHPDDSTLMRERERETTLMRERNTTLMRETALMRERDHPDDRPPWWERPPWW